MAALAMMASVALPPEPLKADEVADPMVQLAPGTTITPHPDGKSVLRGRAGLRTGSLEREGSGERYVIRDRIGVKVGEVAPERAGTTSLVVRDRLGQKTGSINRR
ncbi:MAG TPA: hypothetical protein VK196_22510 [Magnetospirillum sp.]|nr:hypothetical protein [Magnetospirillum sp.]